MRERAKEGLQALGSGSWQGHTTLGCMQARIFSSYCAKVSLWLCSCLLLQMLCCFFSIPAVRLCLLLMHRNFKLCLTRCIDFSMAICLSFKTTGLSVTGQDVRKEERVLSVNLYEFFVKSLCQIENTTQD